MAHQMGSGIEVAYVHAEIDALMTVPRQARSKVTLYVYRLTRTGQITMAKPCEICQTYLLAEGVDLRNVWYTDWSGQWTRMER